MSESKKKTCGAKTRAGGKCRKPPLANGRCKFHGGKSIAAGPGHPTYKNGKFSKVPLIGNLAEKVQKEMENAEQLIMRREIAIATIRINELLEGDASSSSVAIHEANELHERAMELLESGDVAQAKKLFIQEGKKVKQAMSCAEAWREIIRVSEQKRKIIASERDAMIRAGNMVTVSQCVHALSTMVAVVLEKVEDPEVIFAIRSQYASLVGPADNHRQEDS